MNNTDEQMWFDFLDGKLKESQLDEHCRKLANLYYQLINCYFSCEKSILENVKLKIASQE
ncbi:MAG TPA: hypothetical protein PK894_01990 [Defluviitoga sp.]|nr:hypothetical protein [Defluviitoga sp.]HOP24034.1 hypothetical protein [Defluviitoga sp.]HPZ29017.1 hypothetical protein [Defluviitoga sp.]HQD62356.1 hypothetical protein [Defluviitoga sp.]